MRQCFVIMKQDHAEKKVVKIYNDKESAEIFIKKANSIFLKIGEYYTQKVGNPTFKDFQTMVLNNTYDKWCTLRDKKFKFLSQKFYIDVKQIF